jgi:hypothetical protein
MFRKGKALGEQGFFEKAEKVLEELKTQNAAGCVSFYIMLVAHVIPTLDSRCSRRRRGTYAASCH